MWGSEDLIADLGGRPGRTSSGTYLPAVEEAQTRILYAARAAGVMPIDTVLADIAGPNLLRADSDAAVSAGFAAKACIHPSQVAVVREAFRPTPEQIRWAREVTTAAATEPAVFRFADQMVDRPVLAHAAKIVVRSVSGSTSHACWAAWTVSRRKRAGDLPERYARVTVSSARRASDISPSKCRRGRERAFRSRVQSKHRGAMPVPCYGGGVHTGHPVGFRRARLGGIPQRGLTRTPGLVSGGLGL
jgi:hypothetical protein